MERRRGNTVKRWWLVIVLLLSIGMNIGLLLGGALRRNAWQDNPSPPDRRGQETRPLHREERMPPVVERLADELQLRGPDRERFIEIQRAFFAQVLGARRQVMQLQGELRLELLSEDPREEKVESLLAASSLAHQALERAFVDNVLQSRELLDADQERRFFRLLDRLRNMRRDGERSFRRPRPRGEGRRTPLGPPLPRQRGEPPPAGNR